MRAIGSPVEDSKFVENCLSDTSRIRAIWRHKMYIFM